MGYKFNPFTGTLDNAGSASITVPGSNTQIIFNDGGAFGANSNLTFNKTTSFLTVGGNAKLNSTNPILYLENTGANSATSGRLEFRSSGGAEYVYFTFDASANAFRQYYQTTEVYRISSTGQMQWRDGSVSAPAISFYGDTNTGIYRSTSDQLDVAVGGSNMMKVNSSGVGIGGNNPGGGFSYLCTPSGLATTGDYGWSVQNAFDYITTYFKAPDYSLAGGIYGDGLVNIISGQNFSNGGSGTPDITIQAGHNYASLNAGNIYITGYTQVDGGASSNIILSAGASNSSYAGEMHLNAGDCSGSYQGGDWYSRAGGYSSNAGGTPGNYYIDAGTDTDSVGNAGYLRIMSYSYNGYLSFFGATGIQRATTAHGSATHTGGAANIVYDDSTFNGYTIGQVVQALQDYGLLT